MGNSLNKAGHIETHSLITYPLLETNLNEGGKEDARYVSNQLYQRFEQLWVPDSEIATKTSTDPKTIRKYLPQEDFSHKPPVTEPQPSKLDSFKPIIHEWLDEEKKHWRKQHHTAQRVYGWLKEDTAIPEVTVSYYYYSPSTVWRSSPPCGSGTVG